MVRRRDGRESCSAPDSSVPLQPPPNTRMLAFWGNAAADMGSRLLIRGQVMSLAPASVLKNQLSANVV